MPKRKPKTKTFKFQFTDKTFKAKIQELLARAQRLADKEARGFHYEKVWVKPTWVKRHHRTGYHAMRPVKP